MGWDGMEFTGKEYNVVDSCFMKREILITGFDFVFAWEKRAGYAVVDGGGVGC